MDSAKVSNALFLTPAAVREMRAGEDEGTCAIPIQAIQEAARKALLQFIALILDERLLLRFSRHPITVMPEGDLRKKAVKLHAEFRSDHWVIGTPSEFPLDNDYLDYWGIHPRANATMPRQMERPQVTGNRDSAASHGAQPVAVPGLDKLAMANCTQPPAMQQSNLRPLARSWGLDSIDGRMSRALPEVIAAAPRVVQPKRPSHVSGFFRIAIAVAAIGGCMQTAKVIRENNEAKHAASMRMMDLKTKAGYRLQPDGTERLATSDELWREGTSADYRYSGRTSGGEGAEIYAREGEQKVYGKILNGRYMDIEGEMTPVDVEFAGYWSSEGVVTATDGDGNRYQIRVTGRAEP